MSGWTDDNLRGRTAASVVRHHLRRRPHYADLFDDDLDVVADRLTSRRVPRANFLRTICWSGAASPGRDCSRVRRAEP
jgi:hypothetical protein